MNNLRDILCQNVWTLSTHISKNI